LYFFIGFLGSGSGFALSLRLAGFDWAHSLRPQRIRDMVQANRYEQVSLTAKLSETSPAPAAEVQKKRPQLMGGLSGDLLPNGHYPVRCYRKISRLFKNGLLLAFVNYTH